jgi:hypothetical protein
VTATPGSNVVVPPSVGCDPHVVGGGWQRLVAVLHHQPPKQPLA